MKPRHSLTALLAAGLLPALAAGQTCNVVTDLDTIGTGYSSNPEGEILGLTDNEEYSFVQLGGFWYFSADTLLGGEELYRTDGTAAGTTLVCDIFPGSNSGSPNDLILCAGDLFFNADDPYLGKELHTITGVGAYSQDLGLPSLGAPSLRSTSPVLGSSITFSGDNAPAGTPGFLVMSGHVGAPSTLLTGFFSVNWLDIASASIQGVITTPSWSITKPIPANPALTGVQLNLQGWFLPGAAFPADTTNGLHLVVGN